MRQGERMNFREKLILLKEKVIQWIITYKNVVIPSVIGVFIFVLVIINMNLFQITYFRMKHMPDKVVNILTKAKEQNYDDLYFKQGLQYLVEDASEVSRVFLEKHFKNLDTASQDKILEKYNAEGIQFVSQQEIFDVIIQGTKTDTIKAYMKKLDDVTFERALSEYFDASAKLTQDSVDALYTLLSLKGERIPLKNFKLSIFELLNFPHNGDAESISVKILDYIQPESVKTTLTNELKTNEIEVKTLSIWVDILNKKRIITAQEYLNFTNAYGMIKKSQESLKQIQLQEVDLINMKQTVDVETDVIANQIVRLQKDIKTMQDQTANINEQVSTLKNYKQIDLYILDKYENGEYEAAIPEKSWLFGTYKPSSQKVRLKTTRSSVGEIGVHSFKVYDGGRIDGNVRYYTEVSEEQLIKIEGLEDQIRDANAQINTKNGEIDKLNKEIDEIRKTNNYDATLSLIEELELKKNNIAVEIEKNRLAIQTLFGIGNVIV